MRVLAVGATYHPVVPANAGTAVSYRSGTRAETFFHNDRRWLWVPAFAGTTKESAGTTG